MIDFLFSTVGIVITIGYLPQVYRLAIAKTGCYEISVIAWLLWAYAATVMFLYSVFELEDLKMIIVNAINMSFIDLIILITLYKRWKYKVSD